MESLFLIDASGYIYRSYFAIRNMTNDKGESTNALYGFIRSLLKLIKDFQPTHMAAVFDGPRNAQKRIAIYPQYKAHRSAMPDDLRYQIAWAHAFCNLAGIPFLDIPEAEADDVIGSIALWAAERECKVYMCTSDKDMCQLVNERILILNTFKENQIIDATEVKKIHGVTPRQMIDLLALVGDASDNVPGIAGIGAKTAMDLLQCFGSLDYILDHPQELPGKKRQEAVSAGRETALISRKLVTIDTAVTVPYDTHFYAMKPIQKEALKDFYAKMNFNTLIRDLETNVTEQTATLIQSEEVVDYQLIDDPKALEELIHLLQTHPEVCVHAVSDNAHPLLADFVGLSFSCQPQQAWYVPLNGSLGKNHVLNALKPLLELHNVAWIGHNIKHDDHVLHQAGIHLGKIGFDTLIASYILNSHNRQHSLESLILENFGKVKTPLEQLLGKGKKQIRLRDVPEKSMCQHFCEEVDYMYRLKLLLEKELGERNLSGLLQQLELPLLRVLARMERKGIYVDTIVLSQLAHKLNTEIQQYQEDIFKSADGEFNLNSPLQLQKILFDKLAIPYPKKRSGSLSTGEEILELLRADYPIAGKILDYRKLEKLRSTYVEALPAEINPHDQRIHCTFNQSVAATGRLSCQNPNLQNIPVRTEMGREIRAAFKPQKEGWSFLAADYSQIELRLLAHFSEDPYLVDAFQRNLDIHAHTAASVYGISIEDVTKEQRHNAKAVNFGLLYGQGAFGLSQGLSISPKEAQQFIDAYFKNFTKVRSFLESSKEKARQTGKAVTLTGRERLIPEIHSKNGMLRSQAERLAVNTPIQGSAADLIKMAMLKIDKQLHDESKKGYMILQVHDELIFEVPDEELESINLIVRNAMETIVSLKVPLIVDIHVGKNWKEC